jgi:uncharacterized protein
MFRRTPCVGICSTTYGDLVCRGCKRFSHEIVQWNAFDADQRRAVWDRLLSLRSGAVQALVEVTDEPRLLAAARRLGIDAASLNAENLVYEMLQRLQWRERRESLAELGVRMRDGVAAADPQPGELLARIDQEFWHRSVADYERSYRIPAR